MASTTFVDGQTVIEAAWLNDVNAVVYTPGTVTAANVSNTPNTGSGGTIAATTVQAALNELDAEKQPLDATLTAIADESLGAFSHRNKIINGKMNIAQRGTGFTDPNDVYTLDRWKINVDSLTGAAWSVSQDTTAQDAINYGNLLRYSVTTVGSMTFADIRQPIEDVRTLQGKQVTVSFLLRYGAVGKTITARLEQNFGSGGSAQVITTVFTATGSTDAGFTRYSGTVTLPSVAGKTIGAGNSLALVLKLTAPNAGDYVDVTHVQLEEGSVATPFEQRPIGTELALCRRYYEKSYALGTAPATATPTNMVQEWVVSGAGAYQSSGVRFTQEKRALPTITIYSSATGATGVAAAVVAAADKTVTLEGTGTNGTCPYFGLAAADLMRYHWTADAEL